MLENRTAPHTKPGCSCLTSMMRAVAGEAMALALELAMAMVSKSAGH
jgi:hypothetical protein